MKFIVDAQLPRVLALRFIELGHDAIHVNELPNGGDTRDSEITAFADETGRVVVTKDNDFRHTTWLLDDPVACCSSRWATCATAIY